VLAPWAAAAILAAIGLVLISRRSGHGAGFAAAGTGLTAFIVIGAFLAGSPAPLAQRAATAQRGRLDLMHAYDGPALRAFDYARRSTIDDPDLFAMTAIHVSRAAGQLTADERFAGPFDLPAGRFSARVQMMDTSVDHIASGTVFVVLPDRVGIAGGLAGRSDQSIAFDLPLDATIWLASDNEAMLASAQQADIVAESIVPRRLRPNVDAHAIKNLGRPGALLIYADDDTYPEGGVYWTQGTRAGKVYVAPAGASTLALTLHVGPVSGTVHVAVDGHDRSVTMSRDQTLRIEVGFNALARLVPIVVQAPGSFRPADHEPGSTDRRWLGCQVRIELR
jgi:hypothetical protein